MKKRDIAFEILETLKKEGIDLSQIKKTVCKDGKSKKILLKEMNVDGIDSFIKKYNWNPDFPIGNQIDIMRRSEKHKNPKINNRMEALSIRRPIVYSKEGLESIISILESLKKEGVDVEFIHKKENFRYLKLGEIDTPITSEIIAKLNLSEDYPIGKRLELLAAEYSSENSVQLYEHTPEEYERIRNLGLGYSYKEQVYRTLEVLHRLEKEGVDLSSANDIVIDKDGKRRKKYIYELDNPNIEDIIKKLDIPRFYLIGKRIAQIKSFMESKFITKETKTEVREELFNLGLIVDARENIIREILDVIKKLEEHGVDIAKIPLVQKGISKYKSLEDLEFDNKEGFFSKYGIDRDYKIGRALNRIYNIAKNEGILERYNLTQEEKDKIRTLYQNRLNEFRNNSISQTLRLIELLEIYNIDLNDYSLKLYKDGKQRSLRLYDLPLSEEQLKVIENELGYKPDFNIGNRIINIKVTIEGKGRLSITDEQLREIKKLKIFETKHHVNGKKPDSNNKRIDFFNALKEAGIDLSTLNFTYTFNHKTLPLKLGMLSISDEKLNEIKQNFNIDENFKLTSWASDLKRDYRKGFLTPEQEEILEGIGMVSKLDKLEANQRSLQGKLDRANKLEKEVDFEIDKKKVNNIE